MVSYVYVCFQAGSRTLDLELTTLSSTHHVELNPSDAGFQDRYIVQEIIKEMAKNRPIDTKGKKGFKGDWLNYRICTLITMVLEHPSKELHSLLWGANHGCKIVKCYTWC